jgi:hypothetical protein
MVEDIHSSRECEKGQDHTIVQQSSYGTAPNPRTRNQGFVVGVLQLQGDRELATTEQQFETRDQHTDPEAVLEGGTNVAHRVQIRVYPALLQLVRVLRGLNRVRGVTTLREVVGTGSTTPECTVVCHTR